LESREDDIIVEITTTTTTWRGEVLTGFWFGGPNGRDHWDDLGVDGRITLR
jgi:hypothetical protein